MVGVDRDPAALARLPAGVEAVGADLEAGAWPAQLDAVGGFDAILVGRYLFRPRLDLLPACLAPGGLLLYETFGEGQARYGRPANLRVVAYEHGFVPDGGGAIVQRLAAVRPPFDPERLPLAPGTVG